MTNDEVPTGERFSHVYIPRGTPTQDSERFRRRIAAYFYEFRSVAGPCYRFINAELGVDLPDASTYCGSIQKLFQSGQLRDVLDAITLVWRALSRHHGPSANRWRSFVQRALEEENVGYRLDERAGVRYFVDEEFERNRLATIDRLANPSYAAVLAEFESAHQNLDQRPADTKGAVRAAFEAVEILSKLMVGGNRMSRLTTREINAHLKPIVESVYHADAVALEAATKFLDGLIGWVSSIHEYRHGQEVEEPAPPPLGLAVAMVSSGATYLRWLAEIDHLANR